MLRQHDRYPERDEVAALSDKAYRLDSCARHWAAGNHTDGLVHVDRAKMLVRRFRMALIDELVAAGVWIPAKDGYYTLAHHNETNETKAQFLARVARNKANIEKRWEARDGPEPDTSGNATPIASRRTSRNTTRIARP